MKMGPKDQETVILFRRFPVDKKKPKLLIAGGGYADIPLVLSAKKLGYHVITSGNRPSDLGHLYSDEYYQADFSDKEVMHEIAEKLGIDAVCSCCNDFSALTSAYIAEKMSLPGHDDFKTAEIIHHKDKYREFALANGIDTPNALAFDNIKKACDGISRFTFPVIVKPVDLTGGKGISVAKNERETITGLKKAFDLSKAKRVVVEEYINGSRHGFSAFLYREKIYFYFSDNEHYYLNPYLVSAASTPSIVSENTEQKLCRDSEKIASVLKLKDGIFHIQFIMRRETPVIIEVCRRAPGDLYVKLVEHATGVDYSSWIVKSAMGLENSELRQVKPKGFFTRHCIMGSEAGILEDVVFDKSLENKIIDTFMWWKKGDIVNDVMTAKHGIVFLKFNSTKEMLETTEQLNKLIRVVIKRSL